MPTTTSTSLHRRTTVPSSSTSSVAGISCRASGRTAFARSFRDGIGICAIGICAFGIRAAGFKTDDDFADADIRRLNIKRDAPIKDPQKPARAAAARASVPRRYKAMRPAKRPRVIALV